MDTAAISIYSAACFMIITIPVYVLFLITLQINRRDEMLKSSFYKLLFSVGIADIGQILALLGGNILARSGFATDFLLSLGSAYCRYDSFATALLSLTQVHGITLIGINRMTAYLFPIRHSQVIHFFSPFIEALYCLDLNFLVRYFLIQC